MLVAAAALVEEVEVFLRCPLDTSVPATQTDQIGYGPGSPEAFGHVNDGCAYERT